MISLTSLILVSPFLTQVSQAARFRISQETVSRLGDFDNNILGYIDAFSTDQTIQEFYGYNSNVANSFDTTLNEITLSSGASNLFLVQASDGLGLFSVNTYNNQRTGRVRMQFGLIGDTASLLVVDDAREVSSQVVQSRRNPTKTLFNTKMMLTSQEQTDGFAIGSLEGNWTVFGELTRSLSGINSWSALSSTGSIISLDTSLKHKIRIDTVDDDFPVQPVPEPLTMLGVSLATALGAFFKRIIPKTH